MDSHHQTTQLVASPPLLTGGIDRGSAGGSLSSFSLARILFLSPPSPHFLGNNITTWPGAQQRHLSPLLPPHFPHFSPFTYLPRTTNPRADLPPHSATTTTPPLKHRIPVNQETASLPVEIPARRPTGDTTQSTTNVTGNFALNSNIDPCPGVISLI
ncbi:hypothetical protein HAX54_006615 [Datura stramonium]|uniref:Uncharacterized protein n=1 Tax=Datura stramonium TaxID=4076 RepID=A0ABS8WU51_DATST|nr:hypothetical protein [Datura stramonium]